MYVCEGHLAVFGLVHLLKRKSKASAIQPFFWMCVCVLANELRATSSAAPFSRLFKSSRGRVQLGSEILNRQQVSSSNRT